jgi:hypothetical protein
VSLNRTLGAVAQILDQASLLNHPVRNAQEVSNRTSLRHLVAGWALKPGKSVGSCARYVVEGKGPT